MSFAGLREASRLIYSDELTGLYNRRFMRQYLRDRLGELAGKGIPLSVIMLDLDGFKQINDTYGHLDGDLVLKRLAQVVREALPPNAYGIRFAGDEFFAFLEGADGTSGVRAAEEIRERVNAETFATPKAPAGITVRVSLGVATFPEDATDPSELVEAADRALYRSKRSGKNCVSRAGAWTLPPELEILKRFPCPRLVGREAELAELERPLSDTAGGGHRFLLIDAGRGLGKSRILLELMRRASGRGLRCFFGRCLDAERAVPYSSLTPLLDACLRRDASRLEAIRSRLSRSTVAELGTLIPGLASAGTTREPLTPEERRSLLFHGVGDLLCLLSAESPLLLLLDDLQFVDEATLEALYRLLDREEGRVVVYAAVQTEALARAEGAPLPLARIAALLRQSAGFQQVGLGRMTPTQVGRMVTEILEEHTPSPPFFERLYDASRGIPLFVEEALKGLITKGALRRVDGLWDLDTVEPAEIPATLEEAIGRGLEALDEEIHTMIQKAAVVGPHVDLALLAGVLGKNPGETLELVDRGKRRRVFEEPGVLADEEEVRFLSQCFQQIVYSRLEQGDRRRTHRRVGEVAEQLAGDQLEQLLGPLAYHFERSDDPVRGELYGRRVQTLSSELFSAAEIASELSLKVGAGDGGPPLDAETWPLAERVLRALSVAVKNMRVYPAGSQLVTEGVTGVIQALSDVLKRVEALTFAEESQTLHINGAPVEARGLLPTAQDLLRIYAEHGIRRCTFERGIAYGEVVGILRILSGPSAGTQQDLAAWERRLEAEGVRHAQVFPVIFLTGAGVGTAWRREERETRLDEATLMLARDTLRALATAVDNIRLYPPESRLITSSLEQLERLAQALFTRIPTLTVAVAEGTIVVNATRPNPRLFGITIEILRKLMEDSGLTSLTIRRGVAREELRAFLTHLAQPLDDARRSPAFWRSVLEHRGITSIEVGTRLYAAAGRLAAAEGGEPEEVAAGGAPAAAAVSEAELALQRAAQWLAAPLGAFLEPAVQEQFPAVVSALRQMGQEELADKLVGRTTGALAEAEPQLRRKAAEGLLYSLGSLEATSRAWLLDKLLEPLAGAAGQERDPGTFRVMATLGTRVFLDLLAAEDLGGAARLAAGLGHTTPGRGEPAPFAEAVRSLVDAVTKADGWAPVRKALRDPDPGRRAEGRAILAGLGTAAIPWLLQLVHDEKDEETRRIAAGLLAAQREAGTRPLIQELGRADSVERVIRIVALLDVIAPTLGSEFLHLLGHPEVEVRAEMARTLTRIERREAMRFLGEALRQQKAEVILGALEGIRGLGGVELLDAVVRVLQNPRSDHILRAACLCLGGLRDPRAVGPLLEVLRRRPRFFGLRKGLPDGIRATAARSLGEIGLPEGGPGLERALSDPVRTVRSAARLALLRLQQKRGAKPSS